MENKPRTDLENLPSEWINAPSGNFYIFGNSYASVIIANEQVISEEEKNEIIQIYKKQFLNSCLEFFNKPKPTRDITGESISSRSIKIGDINLADQYIDPFPNMGEKLLFTVPFSKVDILAQKQVDLPSYKNDIVYKISDFSNKLQFVIKRFLQYQSLFLQDILAQKTLGYDNLDFELESNNLVSFNDNLLKLSQVNNINLSDFTAIKFSFDEQYNIKNITLENELIKKNLSISFSYFSSTTPQNRSETNYFIANLSSLFEKCKNTSVSYSDVVEEEFQFSKKKISNYSDPLKRAITSGDTYGITNDDINKKFASSQEISKKFTKQIQNIAKNSIYQTPCLTAEEKEKIDKKLEDDQEKQAGFLGELGYQIGDTFMDNLPQILQNVGDRKEKELANYIGREVLQRLGFCGLGDLIAMVANTTTSFLDPQEYNEQLTECALQKLPNEKLQQYSTELAKFDNNGPRILQRYRSLVGSDDILPPWKTDGYKPPNIHDQDSFSKKFELKARNPLNKEEDVEIDALFAAYKNSIALEVDSERILQSLVSAFPDEMGWVSFFTDATKIFLQKCSDLSNQDNPLAVGFDFCKDKDFSMPSIPRLSTKGSPLTAAGIARQLADELKGIIINLVIKLITSSLQQIFQIVAAGTSFDKNYFKRGDHIPDLFQNENYMHDNFKKQASNKKRTNKQINDSVRSILLKSIPNVSQELSLEGIGEFLKSISVSVGEYEKINLLKGEASSQTYAKIIYLARKVGLGSLFKNDVDVEKFFLEMGKNLDVARMEQDYFNSIYNYDPWVSFCILDSDMLDRAYFNNKSGITQDQVDAMKGKLKDLQKDKLCYLADTIGSPSGAIVGELSKMITDPNGPIFNKIKKQEGEFFLESVSEIKKSLTGLLSGDLYRSKGVFDISMDLMELPAPLGAFGYNIRTLPFALAGGIPLTAANPTTTLATIPNTPIDYAGFILSSKSDADPINETIAEQLYNTSPEVVNDVLSYFNGNLLTRIPKNYFDYVGGLTQITISDWKSGPYEKLGEDKNIQNLVFLPDENIKKFFKDVDDFNIPNAKIVPFNLLIDKQEMTQKYFYYSSLISVLYAEVMFKSLNIYSNFTLDTSMNKQAATQYINNYIDKNIDMFPSIRDNIVQILFSLPFQEEYAEELSEMASAANESIGKWLRGEYDSISIFYSENSSIIERANNLFVEIVLESQTQENINDIFKNTDNLKDLQQLSFLGKSLTDILNPESEFFTHPKTSTILLNEKYYSVGTPTVEGYPSGFVSIPDLESFVSSNPSLEGISVSEVWPDGWLPAIRISSLSSYSSSTDPKTLLDFVLTDNTGNQALYLPLVSYTDKNNKINIISKNLEEKYPTQSIQQSFVDSDNFKKFYTSMNIEEILTYYTNYYIGETNERIEKFGAEEDFFDNTKKTLLEMK